MSTGLKTISISNGAIEYLQSILDTEPAHDRPGMRKINNAHRAITPAFAAMQASRKAIRDKYMKKVEQADQFGNKQTKMVIPAEDSEANRNEQEALAKMKVEVTIDRETMSFLKVILDNVFERADAKQSGLPGLDQLELFEEISRAVYVAMDLDYDAECVRQEEAIEKAKQEAGEKKPEVAPAEGASDAAAQ